MDEFTQVEQAPNECCRDMNNREEPVPKGNGLTVSRCSVCGANHYVLNVDPVELGLTAQELK